MKILFLTENNYCGGLDTFLIALLNHWPHPEDELYLVCNAAHPGVPILRERITRGHIVTHNLVTYPMLVARSADNTLLRVGRRILSPMLRYGILAYCLVRMRGLLRQWNPDRLVVVNGGHPGGDTCRAAVIAWSMLRPKRAPAIYNFHGLVVRPRWFEVLPESALDICLVRSAKSLVGVSQSCAKSLRLRLGDRAMGKVTHILNGIAAPSGSPGSGPVLREELGLEHGTALCLMLGTYEPHKGHQFLFQAFRKVLDHGSKAHLLVCGYGYPEEINRVRKLADHYDLRGHITLQGFRRDVATMLTQVDVLLVASQAFESFGLTSVEAMANRVPVVATCVGGIPEVVVDDDGGYCVAPQDVDTYARRITALITDPVLRRQQADRGHARYFRLFRAERMAAAYASVVRAP